MTRRAHVAVLFCDLVGSTALLSALGDVANDELRRDVFAVLRRPIGDLGGHEVKSQGDGLMVAFEREADAVACAVAMQEGLDRLAARDRSVTLALRVGVAAGEATAEEDDWFGTPVVEAARLCGVARSGQVLLTQPVADAVAGAVTLVDEGPRELKGLPEPRPTWSVPWQVADDGGSLPLPPALQVPTGRPLVGRSEPLEALASAWAAVRDGGVRTVLVTGEAGIGKSRLAAELAGRAHDDGAVVLTGRAVAGGDGREAFAEALRWWVVGSPPDVVRHATAGLRPALDRLLPSLATRLGPAPDVAAPGDPAGDVRAAVLALLGRLAADEAVVLVVDDAHLLGPDGVELVVDLTLGAAATRLLVVVAGRDDADARRAGAGARLHAKLDGAVEVASVRLGALADADAAELVGVDDDEAVALANAEAGGNPARLLAIARHVAPGTAPAVERVRAAVARSAPYKGLAAFGPDDRDLLFGRDALVRAVVERLATARLVAVVGPSGSGKSSVVHAGVLPALADGALTGSSTWSVAVLAPGADPSGALDAAVPAGGGGGAPRLVVVDQAEELFTLCPDDDRRRAALDRLLAVAGDVDGSRVLLTVRADFFGRFAESPGLAALLEVGTVLAPPLTEAELRAAVEGPAAVAGLRLEPGLVDVVVADALDRPGALPLVSHAMFETWRRRRGTTLTLDDLREVGGVDGAVARTADDVYVRAFDGREQAMARSLLVRLTEPGEGTEDTRRRVARAELAGVGDGDLDHVIETLVAARLLTVDADHVEVAHEAVIRSWPRLRGWLDEDRDALRVHRRLTRAATEWDEGGRLDAELYRGARLDAALEWRDAHPGEVSEVERALIDASEAQRRSEEEAAEAQVVAQRRANRRLRSLLVAAAVALVVAVVAAVLAVRSANEAEDLATTADARAAAGQATSLAGQDAVLGRILAAEAHALRDLPETRAALATVLGADGRLVGVVETGTASQLAMADDGTLVVAGIDAVQRWDPVAGERRGDPIPVPPGETVLSPDGSDVLSAGETDATVTDLVGTRAPTTLPAYGTAPRALAVGGERLLRMDGTSWQVVSADGTELWSAAWTADRLIDTVALSLSGDRVAVARSEGVPLGAELAIAGELAPTSGATLEVLDVSSGQVVATTVLPRPASAVAFSPDASAVAVALPASSASDPGSISGSDVLTVPDLDQVLVLDGDDLTPLGDVLPGDWLGWAGDRPATVDRSAGTGPAGSGGAVLVWEPDLTRAAEVPLPAVVGTPTWIGGSGDVVVTGAVGAARVAVWDLARTPGLVGDPLGDRALSDVHVSADGRYVVATAQPDTRLVSTTATGPRTVVVELATGEVVAATDGQVLGVAPDGRALVDGRWRTLPDLAVADDGGDGTSELPPLGTLSPDGQILASWAGGSSVELVGLTDDAQGSVAGFGAASISQADDDGPSVGGVSFSGDGRRLAVWFADMSAATVVDVATGETVGPPIEATAGVTALALDATGERVAVGSADGTVTVRAVATGEQRWLPMGGQPDAVIGLRWLTPGDGNPPVLVSVGAGGAVVLYEPGSGTTLGQALPVRVLPGGGAGGLGIGGGVVDGAARLVLGTPGGLVEVNVVTSSWQALACELAGRSFTDDEWTRYFPGRPARTTCGP